MATDGSWPRKEEKKRRREERKKRKGGRNSSGSKVAGQGGTRTWRTARGEEERGKTGGGVLRSGTTDVIFIPGPGRGQRGHQRTGDE